MDRISQRAGLWCLLFSGDHAKSLLVAGRSQDRDRAEDKNGHGHFLDDMLSGTCIFRCTNS